MGWFDRDKMSDEAGEWAAMAMGCMVFADGQANEAEIAAARGQAASNPVIKETIGTKRAEELFDETVQAVGQIPSAMLSSYDVRLQGLAKQIKRLDDKNFALATVIAVAMGDRSVSEAEHAMLLRFREILGANINVPGPGQGTPVQYRQVARVAPEAEATGQAASTEPKPQGVSAETTAQAASTEPASQAAPAAQASTGLGEAAAAGAAQAAGRSEGAVGAAQVVACPNCGKPTQFYPGYGNWCADCQQYASTVASKAGEGTAAGGAQAARVEGSPAQQTIPCPSCGKPTQFYAGYGHWCADCQRYATQSPV